MKTLTAKQAFLNSRQDLSPVTIQWYDRTLTRFAEFYPKLPTKPGPIEEYLTARHVSVETKRCELRILRGFYRFLKQRRHIRSDPTGEVNLGRRAKKIRPSLEPREMMELLRQASNTGNLRDKAIIYLFEDTGVRVGELISLRKNGIGDESIRVSGKTGEREIPISDETRRLLLALSANDAPDDYVFKPRGGGPYSRSSVYFIIHSLMEKAGIRGPKLGPHRIRHGFGKNFLVNGGDLRSLQELMGHANISTTQEYASLAIHDLIAKHHKFTPLRSAHAAAQESFFDTSQAVKEAEEIVAGKRKEI